MDNQGWIKLHRSFVDWEWFDKPGMVWLFVKFLLLANHEDRQWHGITIPRGSFVTSYQNLSSKKAGFGVQSIRTMINRLKSTGELTIKTTNKYTVVSINNYNKYQEINKQTNTQLTNNQQTTNNKQERKEVKNREVIPTSKNSLTACTEEELLFLAKDLGVDLRSVKNKHLEMLDKISDGSFQAKKYGKTVYYTLRNWIRLGLANGSIKKSQDEQIKDYLISIGGDPEIG